MNPINSCYSIKYRCNQLLARYRQHGSNCDVIEWTMGTERGERTDNRIQFRFSFRHSLGSFLVLFFRMKSLVSFICYCPKCNHIKIGQAGETGSVRDMLDSTHLPFKRYPVSTLKPIRMTLMLKIAFINTDLEVQTKH